VITSVPKLYGKKNQKLPTGLAVKDANNVQTGTIDFTYDMDAQGYPAKYTIHDNYNNKVTDVLLTYDK
jgi:hypothetical protein